MSLSERITTAGNMKFPPPEPTAGFPYQITALAGEGAMGAVYCAHEAELDRQVAIKVIKPSFLSQLDPDEARMVRRRFLQEARAAAGLSHSAVVSVHRVGTERGWPYIVMEWLEATSLETRLIAQGTLSPPMAGKMGLELLGALAAAHEQGIVHRDIKPANIMIGGDDQIKLVDFGIARMRDSGLAKTMPGQVLGTPWYAAPEQLESRAMDRRADLYGLSAVLYEALCGRPPYNQDSLVRLLQAHQNESIVPLSQRVPAVPGPLCDTIMRGLCRDPDDRFPNASVMARALQASLSTVFDPASSGSARMSASRRTQVILPEVTMERLEDRDPTALILGYCKSWKERRLGAISRDILIDEISDRPLHADPFCGAVEASGVWMLVSEGLIHTAFDPQADLVGDEAIESMPDMLDATLFCVPATLPPYVVALLAASFQSRDDGQIVLDSTVTDLVELQDRLQRDDFDGVLRLDGPDGHGLVLFRQGRRILDLFGGQWEEVDDGQRWEEWIHLVKAEATVEKRRPRFPAVTFRQQLQGVRLIVERPEPMANSSMREDAVAEAEAITLVPSRRAREELSRGQSTIGHLVHSDPAWALARYAIAEMPLEFEQHGRDERWQRLIEPMSEISSVILHERLILDDDRTTTFDAVTLDAQDRRRHLLHQTSRGTAEAVERFIDHVLAIKEDSRQGAGLDGAVLMAPAFEDGALAAWMSRLKQASGGLFRSAITSFRHQEGLFHTRRGSVHILLVEQIEDGKKRPLMPA